MSGEQRIAESHTSCVNAFFSPFGRLGVKLPFYSGRNVGPTLLAACRLVNPPWDHDAPPKKKKKKDKIEGTGVSQITIWVY